MAVADKLFIVIQFDVKDRPDDDTQWLIHFSNLVDKWEPFSKANPE